MRQMKQGGLGGTAAKKEAAQKNLKKKSQGRNLLNRNTILKGWEPANLKITLGLAEVCKVNTRGLLSVPSVINTGLCGICEKGFSKSSKQTSWKETRGYTWMFHS